MNKVWVFIRRIDWEGSEIFGIFSSYEKAVKSLEEAVYGGNIGYTCYRKVSESEYEELGVRLLIEEWDVS
jgi:hypothetical protein